MFYMALEHQDDHLDSERCPYSSESGFMEKKLAWACILGWDGISSCHLATLMRFEKAAYGDESSW